MMTGRDFTIVPILVGGLDFKAEQIYGRCEFCSQLFLRPVVDGHTYFFPDIIFRIFAPYLDDPSNFFVVSSDFCHWGSRFRYTPVDRTSSFESAQRPVHEYIEWLDREGMTAIEAQDGHRFNAYLKKHKNTICGRHPIAVHSCSDDTFPAQYTYLVWYILVTGYAGRPRICWWFVWSWTRCWWLRRRAGAIHHSGVAPSDLVY
jgi:hypothetical protein